MSAIFSSVDVLSLAAAFPSFAHNFIRTRSISSRCNNRNQAFFHPTLLQFGVCKAAPVRNHTVVALASQTGDQKNRSRRGRERAANLSESDGSSGASKADFVVVNFYQFVFFKDPESEISKHLEFLEDLDIRGRIYINEQGINAQYSGPSKDALSYVEWLKEDERYSDILVQVSPALYGHAFPKLKVQFKSLVQLEGGISNLPLLDPSMRATPLAPSEWKKKLEAISTSHKTSTGNPNPDRILLDVRNGYEWDIGHFREAKRPEVDCFRSTSFGLSESEVTESDPLADVDKEKTEILMYCTGGIRCDVYSTILRNKGFKNLYTLEGGVSNYLENEGPIDWVGNLFVFDSRLSLPPSAYNPQAATTEAFALQQALEKDKFAKCYICGSLVHELRHRNCANIDCNLLFLCCSGCIDSSRGCCCSSCTTAPRLRPVLHGHQRYQKWHVYRDLEVQPN